MEACLPSNDGQDGGLQMKDFFLGRFWEYGDEFGDTKISVFSVERLLDLCPGFWLRFVDKFPWWIDGEHGSVWWQRVT